MKIPSLCALLILTFLPPLLQAAPDHNASVSAPPSTPLRYKIISGYKQPFDDDFRLHLSKGWTPVGGVSATTWNGDLYFAQLLSHPADQ